MLSCKELNSCHICFLTRIKASYICFSLFGHEKSVIKHLNSSSWYVLALARLNLRHWKPSKTPLLSNCHYVSMVTPETKFADLGVDSLDTVHLFKTNPYLFLLRPFLFFSFLRHVHILVFPFTKRILQITINLFTLRNYIINISSFSVFYTPWDFLCCIIKLNLTGTIFYRSFQVEIMMALEEQFGVTVGEGGAENIATVQDAADFDWEIEGYCIGHLREHIICTTKLWKLSSF